MPGYEYEKLVLDLDMNYLDKADKIEELRNELNISNTSFTEIMKEDIYNSTKIEGNQLTRNEVTYYLDNGVTIRGKSLRDFTQIKNYQNTLEAIKNGLLTKQNILSEDFILQIHQMITRDELSISESGIYRQEPVHIRYTDYIPPIETEVPYFMQELIEEYNKPLRFGERQYERICEFKCNFEKIHPFLDGNGRTGRVIMNILFLQNGYSYITIPAEERDLYFKSLENNTFHKFAAEKMLQSFIKIKERRSEQSVCKSGEER